MNDNLELTAYDVSYKPIPVTFNTYNLYKQKAEELAAYVKTIPVTEDNIKDVKKDLAKVRKVVDGLTQKRIEIKKVVLQDFTVFEEQVKELTRIVDEADRTVRYKVRELEEKEREEKEAQIRVIWDERAPEYSLCRITDFFYSWLAPQHLNKSTSMAAVERDMIDWLERHETEWKTVEGLDVEYQTEYLGCLDLAQAINKVQRREELERIINRDTVEKQAMFIVTGTKDVELAERLLKENSINYERK